MMQAAFLKTVRLIMLIALPFYFGLAVTAEPLVRDLPRRQVARVGAAGAPARHGDAADDAADPVRAGDQRARPARAGGADRPDRRPASCRSPSSSASTGGRPASPGPGSAAWRRCSRATIARFAAGDRRSAGLRWPARSRPASPPRWRWRARSAAVDSLLPAIGDGQRLAVLVPFGAATYAALAVRCSRGRWSMKWWRWSGRAERRSGRLDALNVVEHRAASSSILSIRYLTRSPIETMPMIRLAFDHRQVANAALGHQRQRAHHLLVARRR